ncbi:hypothetical protein HWI79_3705, partial [Cryptosporidium felis]
VLGSSSPRKGITRSRARQQGLKVTAETGFWLKLVKKENSQKQGYDTSRIKGDARNRSTRPRFQVSVNA